MVRGGWFQLADYAHALCARRVLERLRAGIARTSDCFLDFRALEVVGVDLACDGNWQTRSLQALEAAGFSPAFAGPGLTCLQPARLWRRCE
jgi:hypothetical protein